ncbi:MAG: ABC transporter permease, partial [Phycisphaerae bacterium]|nr:ABC transporter permease [Saprospiraceae bacterium]
MIQNYWKVLFRNFQKNKFFSAINIFGLAVGMSCCMLISLYIFEETHYDRQHPRANDLYEVGTTFLKLNTGIEDKEHPTFHTPAPLGGALQREFPEIEKTARLQPVFDREKTLIRAL